MLYWNPWVVPGLVSSVLVIALGLFVLMSSPLRLQNRAVAVLLVVEGSAMLTGTWFMYSVVDPRLSFGAQAHTVLGFALTAPIYLVLISTLETPLVRWLRSFPMRVGLVLFVPAMFIAYLLDPFAFVTPPTLPTRFAPRALVSSTGPASALPMFLVALTCLYGVVAAVSAYRRARPGSAARGKALGFAWAFGLRDALFVSGIAVTIVIITGTVTVPDWFRWFVGVTYFNLVELVYAPVLAYAILRHQLFDIDLKIKWGINRGTMVGVFLAVFFVVSIIAENWLTEKYGLAWGGVAAGLLLFALNPLQRLADHVSDAVMPNVRDDPEYRLVRKRQVYLAALESAQGDGSVSDRERDVLATLAQELGLGPKDVLDLERGLGAAKGLEQTAARGVAAE